MDTTKMSRDELASAMMHRLDQGNLQMNDMGEWKALVNCLALKCLADPSSRYAKALPAPR